MNEWPIRMAVPLLLVALGGCGGTKVLKEPRPIKTTQALATVSDHRITAMLDWVIVRDGPGTWAKNSDWDEYLLRVSNRSDQPIRVTRLTVVDSLNTRIEPRSTRTPYRRRLIKHNWGAIMYFEQALLMDPRLSSESDRLNVYNVVAHEMAHQWFGNLVTMEWWDDLWLNEGYATWMAEKAATTLRPQWNVPLLTVKWPREYALQSDASDATHPVVQPVVSVDAASQAFDSIAYNKGSAVIRMLEASLGETGFRDGIRRYMRRYAYGNAVTDQLWSELATATNRPVIDIARDFTLQPGVPLVQAEAGRCESGRTRVTLTQGRFETGTPSPARLTWRIPVTLQAVDSKATASALLGKDGAPVSVEVGGCGPVVVNAGQTGYFRTQYTGADLARIRERLRPDRRSGSARPAERHRRTFQGRPDPADELPRPGRGGPHRQPSRDPVAAHGRIRRRRRTPNRRERPDPGTCSGIAFIICTHRTDLNPTRRGLPGSGLQFADPICPFHGPRGTM